MEGANVYLYVDGKVWTVSMTGVLQFEEIGSHKVARNMGYNLY